ncbi:unannotated protein [freshwater metagenome]|uniref:Unannotated protein n=1 Tax=freshwater metagenome TaxID=449393 RepID=A0A6J7EJI2_9ZZZZ
MSQTIQPENRIAGASPASLAEIGVCDQLVGLAVARGLAMQRISLWVRADRRPVVCLMGALVVGGAALMSASPLASGFFLVVLLGAWAAEASGRTTPLSLSARKSATQDALNRGAYKPNSKRVLLLVRSDTPRKRGTVTGLVLDRSWPVLGFSTVALLVIAAAEAIADSKPQALSALALLPVLAAVVCIAAVILSPNSREGDSLKVSGINQALDAIDGLKETDRISFDLLILGAGTEGRDRRVLKRHRGCDGACRTWEFESGPAIISAAKGLNES